MHIPEHSGERLASLGLDELGALLTLRVASLQEMIARDANVPENLKHPITGIVEVLNAVGNYRYKGSFKITVENGTKT